VSGDGVCENNAGDAKVVTVTVDRKGTAADIESTGGTICEGDTFSLSASSSTVTNPVFTWYSDASLTTVLGSTDVMPASTTTYYVTVSGDGVCENNAGDAKEVTVVVDRKGTAADIESTGGTICEGDTFSLRASSSTVTNPVFTWYSDASLTTVLAGTDVMPTSTTTYYVTVSGDGVCENNAGDAKVVTVTVDRKGTAADIESTGGTICTGDTFSLSASSSTVTNPVFTWYSDASLTTVLGSTDVMPTATSTYYVTVSGDGVCENNAGEAKEVTVTVTSLPTPTTNDNEQGFCKVSGATVADLQVNESSVVWYDSSVGGNRLSESTELIPGATYYAAMVDLATGCESVGRLAVRVSDCAELEVEKVADVTTAIVGEMFEYTITVSNNGVVTAANVEVVDEVPASLQVISTSNGGTVTGNTVRWQVPQVAAGQSVLFTVTVMAVEENAGVINRVEVTGDNSPPDEDETDPIPVTSGDVNLSIKLKVSDPMVEVGDEFTYQLIISNKSAIPGRNAVVTNYLPEGVEYLASDASGDIQESYDESTGEITFVIPEIGADEEVVITLKVKAEKGGLMTNSAQVEIPGQEDLFEADNSDTVSHNQLAVNIPNVFTPNGDGKNDTWEIEGLTELYPDNEVIVVNRWGGEVYKSRNYQNDWDGGSLNEGTYYYRLTIRDPESGREIQFTGYVTILR
ncbi:Ig-like domain-containing protein, partial [Echinicola sediminis]